MRGNSEGQMTGGQSVSDEASSPITDESNTEITDETA